MAIAKTLKEIDQILKAPIISQEVFQQYVLREYDKYARMLGYDSYEHFRYSYKHRGLLA